MTKPIIGITSGISGDGTSMYCPPAYFQALEESGAVPAILPPLAGIREIRKQMGVCDGFLFIGGPDLSARTYGMKHHREMKCLEKRTESAYLKLARCVIQETMKPALGICLGHQLLNVVLGGTLYRHIPEDVPGALEHRRLNPGEETYHEVELLQEGPLPVLFGVGKLRCNSSHHQAVASPGEGLVIAARSADGVVESVAWGDFQKRFLLGLQWHPERIRKEANQKRPFEALIAAC